MDFVFITQASPAIGMGHLLRCLAFAQTIQSSGHRAVFLVDDTTRALAEERADWEGELMSHDYHLSVEQQVSEVRQRLNCDVAWLIVDGYQFDREYWVMWQHAGFLVALFDDAIHQSIDTADVIVNPAAPQTTDKQKYCYGEQFRLLRREFTELQPLAINQRQFLTVNFGGSDPQLLTLDVVREWLEGGSTIPLQVVTGPAFKGLEELKLLLADTQLPIQHLHKAVSMSNVWLSSRLVIAAAGGSLFELQACGSPCILVVVAENQRLATESAVQQGWCSAIDMIKPSPQKRREFSRRVVQQAIELWYSFEQLDRMQHQAQVHSTGNGAQKLLNHLVKLVA